MHDLQLDKILIEISKFYDANFIDILRNCLRYEPSKRWTVEKLLANLQKIGKRFSQNEIGGQLLMNGENENKNKKGILKKIFSGIFKGKKNKNSVKHIDESNKNSQHEVNIQINEFSFNTKNISLQIYSLEDYHTLSIGKKITK